MPLIAPDNDFGLMAAMFCIAGAAFLAEKTRIGGPVKYAALGEITGLRTDASLINPA